MRRIQSIYPKPVDGSFYANNAATGTGAIVAGRSDYAINCGSKNSNETGTFPCTGATYDTANKYAAWLTDQLGWTITKSAAARPIETFNGVSFQRSEVGLKHLTDGTTTTYLVGENISTRTTTRAASTAVTMRLGAPVSTMTISARHSTCRRQIRLA